MYWLERTACVLPSASFPLGCCSAPSFVPAASHKTCNCTVLEKDDFVCVYHCQAFVFDGDIYYKPSVTSQAVRLTSTGDRHSVVNGLSDWTYEGGIYTFRLAHHQDVILIKAFDKYFYYIRVLKPNRRGAPVLCCPLVVFGWRPASIPEHQQLCHAPCGTTSVFGWPVPLQFDFPLPQGGLDILNSVPHRKKPRHTSRSP